ncbi:unnamed protein product, partial [Amoebophrya sp. A25]
RAWNDNVRTQGSSFGPNISDAWLADEEGKNNFLILRPENFNEKIAIVRARDLKLITG